MSSSAVFGLITLESGVFVDMFKKMIATNLLEFNGSFVDVIIVSRGRGC